MKPCSRQAFKSGSLLQNIGFGKDRTVAKVKGSVKQLGLNYANATIVLVDKSNFSLITICKPDNNYEFSVNGLHTNLTLLVFCINGDNSYNSLIFDNIQPK